MSVSYTAQLVCGFKVDIRAETKTKTMYDPDTGKPYEAKIPSHNVVRIDGVDVMTDAESADAFCNGEEFEGLEFGESGYEQGTKWLGKIVAESGEHEGDFHEFSPFVPDKVRLFSDKYRVRPRWFLSMRCG